MPKNYYDKVVRGGYCIGCGLCALQYPNTFDNNLTDIGTYQPELLSAEQSEINKLGTICPFSDKTENENNLSKDFLKTETLIKDEVIGYYLSNYSGYVTTKDFRKNGSSGGYVSWFLNKILDDKIVDGIIHVGNISSNYKEPIMGYKLSFTSIEINQNSKSRYYPIEISKVLAEVKQLHPDKTFAFVGIPCFIKAIRLLQKEDAFFKNHIKLTIGLVCGHLKSTAFAKSFAWQAGIKPDSIKSIDFRHSEPGQKANEYSIKVTGKNHMDIEETILRQNKSFFGYLWGHGFFKYSACDYCDDVFAETADITFGDAWLPEFIDESGGTNIIINRNSDIEDIFIKNKTEIELAPISVDKIKKSQEAGIRHRREGLKYRLYLKTKRRKWVPSKRAFAEKKHISKKQRSIFKERIKLTDDSHKYFKIALNNNDFAFFKKEMSSSLKNYNILYTTQPSIAQKLKKLAYSFYKKFWC